MKCGVFINDKKHQIWLWWAIDHDTGEAVAYWFDTREHGNLDKLFELLSRLKSAPFIRMAMMRMMTDCTFGVYSRLKIFGIYANTFLGYGSQNYQLRQTQNQHTKFNGDSMYASLELFKPIYLRNNISVSPLLAIDFQKSWSDGFNTNNIVPLTVKKGEMDQTILQLGFNSNYKNWRTRLQYGYQINNRTKLFADYDLDLGEHATAHTEQFGFVRYF
ncbi:MAG: autotransporter domain-containing protein [Planctomycetaceae bacterium]|nr:autotransporter domain-containing protein [Planctomycetaceae bacterium]